MIHGSHLYGLNTPLSDKDFKGVLLPTKKQILLGQANFTISESTSKDNTKNTSDDIDTEMFSLQKFMEMAVKGETVIVDMLHAPDSALLETSNIWKQIVSKRDMFYTKNMKAYLGYVRKQAAKYGVKGSRLAVMEEALTLAKSYDENMILFYIMNQMPIGEYSEIVKANHPSTGEQTFYEICGRKFQSTLRLEVFVDNLQKIYDSYGDRAQQAKTNEGIDWKAISHALRAGYQLYYIYKEGSFTYPLPETQFLLDVKQGKLDFMTIVQPALENLVTEVEELADKSEYPEKVDVKSVEDFIIEIHEKILLGVY